ncbi:thioredoxin family protein [Candidatus Woesearchaeota archaeon]|nr:thioredoxin family protein [Candidatus Woesearchaeota archaeon]
MKTKTISLIVVIALIVGAIYYLESQKVSPVAPAFQPPSEKAASPEPASVNVSPKLVSVTEIAETKVQPPFKEGIYPLAPELTGITGYINAKEGLKIQDFRGKVVLIDFWTYTCINCIRTLPHLIAWDQKYKEQGLVIIGVHSPEFEFEKDKDNVQAAMEKYGITYRVVQDNDHATWSAFKNRFWPHKYLIDKDGYIRYDHIGEGAYEKTEKKIQELLAEINPAALQINMTTMPDLTPTKKLTPELYAGYEFALPRGQDLGNAGGLQPGKELDYILPTTLTSDVVYLEGRWKSSPDALEALSPGKIVLRFTAEDVNIVADGKGNMKVLIDGRVVAEEQMGADVHNGAVDIDMARLYNIINGKYGTYTLTLEVEPGFTFNAFTFG